jgi:hypothetical protein
VADVTRPGMDAEVLKEGAPVFLQDRVRTKSYSKVGITLLDKSVVKLAPGSCVSLEEFRMGDNGRRESARVLLTRGKLEAVVAKTGLPETFVIDTPNARGAVRGSDIFVSYLAGKTGVFVQEGSLALVAPAAPDKKTTLGKGNCVIVPIDGMPQAVRPVLDTEMTIHKRDVSRSLVKKWVPGKGAAQMTASVLSVSGSVRIYTQGAGDWRDASQGDTIGEGDLLQTGEDAKAQLRLSNGNTLLVQPGTELAFVTLKQDAVTGDYENTFEMSRGRVSSVVEKLSTRSTFQLKTPTAVCGVRGTVLDVIVPAPTVDNPAPATQVFFEGGSGVVTSLLTGQTQDVAPGQNVNIDPAGNISPPAATSPEQSTEISGTVAAGQGGEGFSGVQGAGLAESAPAALLDAPASAAPEGIVAAAPLAVETQSLALMSTLTFDQVSGSTLQPSSVASNVRYFEPLVWDSGYTMPTGLQTVDMSVKLRNDGTWSADLSGTFNGYVGSPWQVNVVSAHSDFLQFTMTGPLDNAYATGTFDVTSIDAPNDQIIGTTPTKTLAIDAGTQGTFDTTGPVDTYAVTITGHWTNN